MINCSKCKYCREIKDVCAGYGDAYRGKCLNPNSSKYNKEVYTIISGSSYLADGKRSNEPDYCNLFESK